MPRFDVLQRLADALGCDLAYLTGASDVRSQATIEALSGVSVTLEDVGRILAVHRKHEERDETTLRNCATLMNVPDMTNYRYTGEPDWPDKK